MSFNLTKLVGGVVTLQSTIVPKGAYNGDTIYIAGDSVSYDGKSYVAIQPTQGNLPTNTTYWQLLCEGGGSGSSTFLELTDTPSAYKSQALKVVRVNSGENALEFFDIPASGMENPMTTAGDIIYGGADGTPTRLGKGTASQVLKMNSGATAPEWADESGGGMTDPMTTRGDIIYRDASAPARLAKGASGTVLTMGANDPTWAVPFSQTTQTLTDGATVSWDASAGSCGILTLGGNRALANMTNAIAGRTYTLIVKQDGTGSRTLSYGNQYFTPGDTTPVLSSTANAVDILQFLAESSTVFHLINFISDSK